MSVDSLARPAGFMFSGGDLVMGDEAPFAGQTLTVSTPRPAKLRLLRNGEQAQATNGSELEHRAEQPGVYRVEARLDGHGRERTWILSNPIYLR
jgi:hypothetical protein